MDLGESSDEKSKATWGCEALNILYVDDQGFLVFLASTTQVWIRLTGASNDFLQWYKGAENVLP